MSVILYICYMVFFSLGSFMQTYIKCSHFIKPRSWYLHANLEKHKRFGQTSYNGSSASLVTQIRSVKDVDTQTVLPIDPLCLQHCLA